MHIKHLEWIFSIDKGVPVDVFPVFQQVLLHCYVSRCIFYESHTFPCRSLLLSTTVLNDIKMVYIHKFINIRSTYSAILIYHISSYICAKITQCHFVMLF